MGTKFVNVIKDQTIHSIAGHERFGNAIHKIDQLSKTTTNIHMIKLMN
jgi:hypothetical protein